MPKRERCEHKHPVILDRSRMDGTILAKWCGNCGAIWRKYIQRGEWRLPKREKEAKRGKA